MQKVATKLLAVVRDFPGLEKESTLDTGKYKHKFRGKENLFVALKGEMIKHGLMIVMEIKDVIAEGNLRTVLFQFHITDTESGETIAVGWAGSAADTADKAVAKAITSGIRTWMDNQFFVGSDSYEETQNDYANQRTPEKAAPPAEDRNAEEKPSAFNAAIAAVSARLKALGFKKEEVVAYLQSHAKAANLASFKELTPQFLAKLAKSLESGADDAVRAGVCKRIEVVEY